MSFVSLLAGIVSLFNKLFAWMNKKEIQQAARDEQTLDAVREEDARVDSAEDARDRALAEWDRLHPKP